MNRRLLASLESARPATLAALIGAGCLAGYACWIIWFRPPPPNHRHTEGRHGGTVVAVGAEHYHVEALVAEGGALRLFTLGQDESRVVTVPKQRVTAYVRTAEVVEAVAIPLEPTPQPGDPPGETSAFAGELPLEFVGARLVVVVPNIQIGEDRYRFSFMTEDSHPAQMPRKVTDEAERDLYLTPGGKYTAADIRANGSQTPSLKYHGFRSTHDLHPAAGEAICPITQTKANAACTWIIDGQRYRFCCPPCIDEFVKLAKEHPQRIKPPEEYVQK